MSRGLYFLARDFAEAFGVYRKVDAVLLSTDGALVNKALMLHPFAVGHQGAKRLGLAKPDP